MRQINLVEGKVVAPEGMKVGIVADVYKRQLFDNTILENIRIGNKDATDEQVITAAKLANVDEFAEKLPDGWHTNIGENGCELSGGERQRISIAHGRLGSNFTDAMPRTITSSPRLTAMTGVCYGVLKYG